MTDLDNCPDVSNPDQADVDGNRVGDACQRYYADSDGDRIPDYGDECAQFFNPPPVPGDSGGVSCADLAVADDDGDGVMNSRDSCPLVANPNQDPGDVCINDLDGDGVPNDRDNCPFVSNPNQAIAEPGLGIACAFEVNQ